VRRFRDARCKPNLDRAFRAEIYCFVDVGLRGLSKAIEDAFMEDVPLRCKEVRRADMRRAPDAGSGIALRRRLVGGLGRTFCQYRRNAPSKCQVRRISITSKSRASAGGKAG